MKRMITKKMRDSFKVGADCRIRKFMETGFGMGFSFSVKRHFESTKKQRILILRRVVK